MITLDSHTNMNDNNVSTIHNVKLIQNEGSNDNKLVENRNTLQINDTDPKRVKVYILEDNEWKDTGTGFCTGKIKQVIKPTSEISSNDKLSDIGTLKQILNEAYLIVTNEDIPDQILLESKLEGTIEYQKQEETLIVWKDIKGDDIALSFEESSGCDDICNFLIQVQRNLERNISLVAVRSSDSGMGSAHEIIAGPVALPSIDSKQDTTILMDSLKILNENISYEYLKNETIEFIFKSNYIDLLIDTFHKAENEESLKDLLLLSSIIKTLILYNNREIIESLVDDNHIIGIIGILEYDTEFPTMKANHRDYLKKRGPIFKEVFPVENDELKEIIKKCFRLQFLKDVVLVRFFDDNNINLIVDIIVDFETCIINFLQADPFLCKIINLYEIVDKSAINDLDSNVSNDDAMKEKRRNGIKLLHQCVQMSKNLELCDKTKFYKFLIKNDFFSVLQYAFNIETDSSIRIMATDMIITIIEHDILLIQNIQHEKSSNDDISSVNAAYYYYGTRKGNNDTFGIQTEDMKLLSILSTILLTDKSPGLREQVVQAFNTLLHPDGCLNGNGEGEYDSDGMLSNFSFNSLIEDEKYTNDDADYQHHWFNSDAASSQNLGESDNHNNNNNNNIQLKRYFKNFYDQIALKLFSPLVENINNTNDNRQEYDDYLLIHIVKLLSFIATEHNRIISRKFILENGILNKISKLIKPTHILQLRLTAVRTMKNIVSLNDKYYNRYMITNNLFDPIFDLLKENLDKDNLANSCIQDLFKIITKNCEVNNESRSNFNILNNYLAGRFKDILEEIAYLPFIKTLLSQSNVVTIPSESVKKRNESTENESYGEETQGIEMNQVDMVLGLNQNGKRLFSQV